MMEIGIPVCAKSQEPGRFVGIPVLKMNKWQPFEAQGEPGPDRVGVNLPHSKSKCT
jgi:hypothetical protein